MQRYSVWYRINRAYMYLNVFCIGRCPILELLLNDTTPWHTNLWGEAMIWKIDEQLSELTIIQYLQQRTRYCNNEALFVPTRGGWKWVGKLPGNQEVKILHQLFNCIFCDFFEVIHLKTCLNKPVHYLKCGGRLAITKRRNRLSAIKRKPPDLILTGLGNWGECGFSGCIRSGMYLPNNYIACWCDNYLE